MQGKVCLITGATSGIGEVTARALARMGATTIIVGRNPEKGAAVVNQLKAQTGNPNVAFMLADLSSQAQIRQLAEQFRRQYQRLDVLVNNAGAIFPKRQQSVDGVEMTFAVNHLSGFLLTNLLLDILKASAPSRIINISSEVHSWSKIDLDDLQNAKNQSAAYNRSKLANVLFTYELARRLEGMGVTVNAMQPGLTRTSLYRRQNLGFVMSLFFRLMTLMARTPERAAETVIYLATSPDVAGVSGKYFADKRAIPSSKDSQDVNAAKRLWRVSAELTGLA